MIFRFIRPLKSLFGSSYFIPLLFLCCYSRVFTGTQGFFHDSADGYAAFKFAKIIPEYWNWFEMGGIPYWMDMGWFRLQDPLTWPIILFVKSLPIGEYAAFHVFLLIQVSLLGLLISAFLKEIGIPVFERQIATGIGLFGSLGSSMFAQWGMWGTLYGFLLCIYFLLRLAKTRNYFYVTLLSLTLIQNSLSYHTLLGLPLLVLAFVGCMILLREKTLDLVSFLWSKRALLFLHFIAVSLAYGASFLAPRHKGLLPVLRAMNYSTEISVSGINLNSDLDKGKSLFDSQSIKSFSAQCNKTERCTEYFVKYLQTFYSNQTYLAELPGFVTLTGLFLLLMSLLFFKKNKLIPLFFALTLFTFVLSLGSGTFVWGWTQKLFPILGFVRHTHFYLSFFTFGIITLISLGLSILRDSLRQTKLRFGVTAIFLSLIVFELFNYQKLFFKEIHIDLPLAQRTALDRNLPTTFRQRSLRIRERKLNPRSAVGTAYGYPTAMENTQAKDQILGNTLHPIRFFGYPTPFILDEYLKARLNFSDNMDAFKRVFGVSPYPIFMLYPDSRLKPLSSDRMLSGIQLNKGGLLVDGSVLPNLFSSNLSTIKLSRPEAYDLQLNGEYLDVRVDSGGDSIAYFSIPYGQISRVLIDKREVPFFKANQFGLAFKVPAGKHEITAIPNLEMKRLLFSLFYGSYGMLILLNLVPILIRMVRGSSIKVLLLNSANGGHYFF